MPEHPVLARDKVCYVGQPVAIAVAHDRYLAVMPWTSSRSIISPYRPSWTPGRPHKGAAFPFTRRLAAMSRCVSGKGGEMCRLHSPRLMPSSGAAMRCHVSPPPMEGRGLLAQYQPEADLLTLWASTQVPSAENSVQRLMTRPPRRMRVIAPDVGGGFGQKVETWPEDIALSYLAMALGRPIKWVEERWENLLAPTTAAAIALVEAAV